ncbi:MAG: inorganic pyrophosphatase [Oscillospiraceae bacterium]
MERNDAFWGALDALVSSSGIVIDRPKGSAHPRFSNLIYPVDYGYLKNTSSMDGDGIDVWLGTDAAKQLDALICTVDSMKRDSEIKLLIGCTEQEKQLVYELHNNSGYMKGIMVRRQ